MNVTFGLIEDTSHSPIRDKALRRQKMVDRALAAIEEWKTEISRDPAPVST
jgi:folate-dependent tRNA-U54 methylase TrmFO/GidA